VGLLKRQKGLKRSVGEKEIAKNLYKSKKAYYFCPIFENDTLVAFVCAKKSLYLWRCWETNNRHILMESV